MKIAISLISILISLSCFAQNGIEIIMAHKQFKDNGKSIKAEKNSVIWINESMMKISSDDQKEPIMIYDSEKEVITMIMRDKKQYSEISQAEMEEVNKKLEESRMMMEQQLAQLPESQRVMVKEKMANVFSQEVFKTQYKKVEDGIELGPYTTVKYEGITEGKRTEELYYASIDQFKVDESYFDIYSQMMEFLKENMGNMMSTFTGESQSGAMNSSYPSLEEGLPVKSISYKDGSKTSEEVLEEISAKNIPSEAFAVPSGYKKIDIMKKMQSGK